jgi:hypothetical protein
MKRELPILRLAQIWIFVLIAGSLQPSRPATVSRFHRPLHWLAFAGAALLLLLLARTVRQEIAMISGLFAMGLTLEYLQHFMYRNAMEWHDVRDDLLAILTGLVLLRAAGLCKIVFRAVRAYGSRS